MPIQRADPIAHRKAIYITATVLLLGFIGMVAFTILEDTLLKWLKRNIDFLIEKPEIVFAFFCVVVSPVFLAAIYLLRYGHRVAQSKRLPPPGYSVWRDTKILAGTQAVIRARIVQGLSLMLLCAASAIPILVWYIFKSFSNTA